MLVSNYGNPLGLSTLLIAAAMVTVARATTIHQHHGGCVKMETYNVGLMSGVDETHGRVHRIVDALKASKSDFICIQEAWMERYVSAITEGVKAEFPHHFSPLHEAKDVLRGPKSEGWFPMKDSACNFCESLTVYSGLISCALINGCFSKNSSVSIGACVTNSCHKLLKSSGISDYCVSCVFMNSARHLSEGITQCVLPQPTHNRMNGPGLMVLSRQDMTKVSFTNLFPKNRIITQRGYITAELESGITAVCTHFSPNLDHHGYLEYDTGFGSYKSQQVVEISRVMEALQGSDAVLLGDMNSGPSVTHDANPEEDVDGDLPDNFELLMKGYRSPFLEEDGRCTFCVANPLVQDSPNALIDHIMVEKGGSLTTSHIKRLYDKSDPPLSDHYGVGLQVCLAGNRQEDVCEAGSKDCGN